jgi:general secretion pathway protein F
MASFEIRGLVQGRLERRIVTASSRAEAALLAQQGGVQVLAITGNDRKPWQRSSRFDLTLFAHELMALLQAGLSLIEAVETLAEHQQGRGDQALLDGLVRSVYEGHSFSYALGNYPDAFPALFIATIAASEQTGEMADALGRYLRYQEQVSLVRDKVVSASLYPALLLLVGSAVGLFLLCYLVPRFSHIYEGLDTQLPLASRLLMQWGSLASHHTLAVALGFAGLIGSAVVVAQLPATRLWFSAWLQANRWIGPQVLLMQLSRFYRSISLLLRGGIPLLKSLQMTQALLPLNLQARVSLAISRVNEGQSLSNSLQEAGLATAVALRLIRAGERNGQVADMLEQIATFHDNEVGRWIDSFTRLFEPLLMLFIGGVIGSIVILLYLPIFELASSLQ